jgi:hypothetical protein
MNRREADGASVKNAPLNGPRTIAINRDGDLDLALREGNAIYRVAPNTGTIHHLAGTGEQGYSGDGGPAREARLAGPKGLACARGNLYVADTEKFVDAVGILYVGDSDAHRIRVMNV